MELINDTYSCIRSMAIMLWLYARMVPGLIFYWAPAFLINYLVGTESYAAPLGDRLGPAALWWLIVPALVLSLLNVVRFIEDRAVLHWDEEAWLETGVIFSAGMILFWLWLHDAYALLWPSLIFTGLVAATRGLDLLAAGPTAVTATRAVAPAANPNGATPVSDTKAPGFIAVAARHTFAEVDGMEGVKHELLAFGEEALVTEAEAAQRRKTDPGKTFRNGALLFGSPGNGKTYLAEALAGELGIPFLTVSIARLQSMWIGQTTERVVEAFTSAAAQAPCVLLLDEIDAVLGDRGGMQDAASETPKLVNALLTELSSIRGKGVVVMAATNYPDRLDAAGRREGRFDVKLEIPAPDLAARLGILRRGLGLGDASRLRSGSLEMAARHFAGFSVVRLQAIAKLVRDQLVLRPTGEVRFASLLAALRKVQGVDQAALREVPDLASLVLKPSAKRELGRLSSMMQDIEGTERAGGALQAGAVFYGPPGTGKTLCAQALAKATGWTFIPTTGQDLVRSDEAMDKLMARAADLRPAMVFIDEADDILADRNYSPHTKMATNKLLTLLDGAGGRVPDVLFVAATNNPDLFDSASVRRFPVKIEFALPGEVEIAGVVQRWLDTLSLPVEGGVTVDFAVAALMGLSIADIRVALQEAVNIAIAERTQSSLLERGLRRGDLVRAIKSLSFGH